MSDYTILLSEVVESIYLNDHPDEMENLWEIPSFKTAFAKTDVMINYALPFLFPFDFDCYGDEEDKKKLEYDIISDFYFRELNCDNLVRWQRQLRNKLHDIMPKYVGMYNAQMKLLALDATAPYHIEENRNGTSSRTGTANSIENDTTSGNSTSSTITNGQDTTVSNADAKQYNMPQALAMTGKDYMSAKNTADENATDTYSSTGNNTANTTSNASFNINNTSNDNRTDALIRTVKGNLGKIASGDLVKKYNDAIININKSIINELNDLFFQLY